MLPDNIGVLPTLGRKLRPVRRKNSEKFAPPPIIFAFEGATGLQKNYLCLCGQPRKGCGGGGGGGGGAAAAVVAVVVAAIAVVVVAVAAAVGGGGGGGGGCTGRRPRRKQISQISLELIASFALF